MLNIISTITGCVSISAFASLVGIPKGISSSTIELKVYVITATIKKSIIKKKRKNHDEIVLLVKSKLNNIEALISKALIDSNISYYEFVLIMCWRNFMIWKKKSKIPITNKISNYI